MARIMKRFFWLLLLLAALVLPLGASTQKATPPVAPPASGDDLEFLRAADEVMAEVSRIIELPVKAPLKKSLRSKQQIRDFVLAEMERDRSAEKWAADQKALERFGLIPKDFPLRQFLVDLLTEQIAGLYNPREKEFFIADWIALEEQRVVMAHELVHALQDQHFNVEAWLRAARPNDDALLARQAVLEGSAILGMFDYLSRGQQFNLRELPGLEDLIRGQMGADVPDSPVLAKAPPYIREALLFPYLAGAAFSQRLLKEFGGWEGFHQAFTRPPASSQQILHPQVYLDRVEMKRVTLPAAKSFLGRAWKTLDENVLGEFGLHLLLKQFLGQERAARLSPGWAGDLYGVYEHEKSKRVVLVQRQRFDTPENAARFFGAYSEALELKHELRRGLFRRPNFFSFDSDQGGVFLYCTAGECLLLDGSERTAFDRLVAALRWPAAPLPLSLPSERKVAASQVPLVMLPPAQPGLTLAGNDRP
jgi:hypothetical protein